VSRVRAGVALGLTTACLGVGVALLVAGGVVGLAALAVRQMGGGGVSLGVPGLAVLFGAELVGVALALGWRAGGGREGGEDDEPAAG
jgi:hypothetical protein